MAELQELRERGLAVVREHPELPLLVCNYTQIRQVREEEWTPLLEICRGLIVDPDGVVVARPFSRMGELRGDEQLPQGSFTAFEKLDGSMGIQYPTPEGARIATRGNFIGRQALRGTELLGPYKDFSFGNDITPIWEIIYPENRIVIDYGDREEVVLIGLVDNATGREHPLPDQADVPFTVVKTIEDVESADDLRAMEVPNAEGFVVRMDETGERYKVKFPSFNYLGAIRKGTMPYRAWRDMLTVESADEYLQSLPVGARDEVAVVVSNLEQRYRETEQLIRAAVTDRSIQLNQQQQQVVARIRKGFPAGRQAIWQTIRPERNPDRPQNRRSS
jgi:RNA ligase